MRILVMSQPKTALKFLLAFMLSLISIGYFGSVFTSQKNKKEPQVLQSVTISGNVKVDKISFTVYPEKRIPSSNNWSNTMNVQIRNAGSTTPTMEKINIVSNSAGLGEMTFSGSENLTPGTYDFSIKGISHLRRNYNGYNVSAVQNHFDFSATNKLLLAGDTSIVVDNYVNSLDVSTVMKNFFSSNVQNDLNRDGQVNSLDLSNQITNLWKLGDT